MAKHIKIGNAILCEHAVQGASNKPTLINVYSGDIIVSQLPATLTLGAFIEIAKGQELPDLHLDVSLNDRVFLEISAVIPPENPGSASKLVIPMFGLQVENESRLALTLSAKGWAKTTAIETRIFQGPIPMA